VSSVDGWLSIRCPFYNSSVYLLPEWVTPKHPNPKRNNGLLVVIKGNHWGKYVRRIHHRGEGTAIVRLAGLNKVVGQVDTLTGEQLELDASYLCVCDEAKEDKMLNSLLIVELREEARKIVK
jgi:hypothetical protein